MAKPEFIITVSRPELTPEERARRMKQIHDAAARLVLAAEREKRKKERQA